MPEELSLFSITDEEAMQEDRLTLIETKIAYQESTVQDLNDVIAAQQDRIDYLEALVMKMAERLRALSEQASSFESDERPPHY